MADDESGASAVEYGMLVAGIAAIIVVVVFGLGSVVKNAFANTTACFQASSASTC